MRYFFYLCSLMVLGISCSKDDVPTRLKSDRVEIRLSVNAFFKSSTENTNTDLGTTAEQDIENLYVFLFSATEETKKYYVDNSFSEGYWDTDAGKLELNLSPEEAGLRDVYLVANCEPIRDNLDDVEKLDDLKVVYQELSLPWSMQLTTPILVSGNKLHDFGANYLLDNISLTRSIAKLRMEVTLSETQKDIPSAYKYRFINFDKRNYVIKPNIKPSNVVAESDWFTLSSSQYGTLDSNGKVTSFVLETYLNETEMEQATVEIIIPDNGTVLLPPPEFGDDIYRLMLPQEVLRNSYYLYTISF